MPTSCSGYGDPGSDHAHGPELWVVVPVYNEGATLRAVVQEWLPVLVRCTADVRVCILDDGSTDETPIVLRQLATEYPKIEAVVQANVGHGQACLRGYRLGIARRASFILQIDSDGQCDAAYFPELWRLRTRYPVVFGFRRVRQDGRWRTAVTRLLALGVAAATGFWVRDPNVPYRLMSAAAIAPVVDIVPDDVDLVNVYVSAALRARGDIRWVAIAFRERLAGRSHRRWSSMLRPGLAVIARLARDRRRVRGHVDRTGNSQPAARE